MVWHCFSMVLLKLNPFYIVVILLLNEIMDQLDATAPHYIPILKIIP